MLREVAQKGVHLFGRSQLSEADIAPLKRNHIQWITLVPYGWMASPHTTEIGRRNSSYGIYSRRDSMFLDQARSLVDQGFHVMIKPHIWMHTNGEGWRSDIGFETELEWNLWMENYRKFILHYARLAAASGAKQFCVGTELHRTVLDQPFFWKQLIQEVRTIFPGSLTYAANWFEEVEQVTFWDQLDYIGIQAYYPLCKESTPSVNALIKGWKNHLTDIRKLSEKYERPILFTELGYKSTPDAAIEPWQWASSYNGLTEVCHQTQANCYEAFFQTFWNKDWFAGVHFWEWKIGRRGDRGQSEINFTPQNKPAESVMAKWFSR